MFTHFNKITLRINVKMSCCSLLKHVISFPVQKGGNRALGKEKGIEKWFTFCTERKKTLRGLCKHVLQHESNPDTPQKQVLRHPDYRDETYSNVNSFGTTQIFLPKAFPRARTMRSHDLTGRLAGQTTRARNLHK